VITPSQFTLRRAGPADAAAVITVLDAARARSAHLRVLREARLVRVRSEAQRRWYELDPAPLVEIDAWLEPYRWMWADRLDALERPLDDDEDGRSGR
jgi:DNA-binding transcriptional ArsR family regulator